MAKTIVKEPPYVERLEAALKRELRGAEVKHEQVRRDRYRFIVVWDRFDRMGHPERQRKVWDIADHVLEKSDLLNVSMIITLGLKDIPGD